MKSIYIITIIIFFPFILNAATISGFIKSKDKKVSYARVFIKETMEGATSDENGYYKINDIQIGKYKIVCSVVDYVTKVMEFELIENKEYVIDFELIEEASKLDEVTVTATMKETSIAESPIHIDIITPKLFEKNPSPSIFESLNMVNGVRTQMQCNVCNTGDIHINGMEGPYTMVMIDGMPIVSALGTVYGLMGIPNSIIQRVEIQKGPSSTLYGSEAVGGLINVITKTPDKSPLVSVDVFGTTYQEFNTDLSVKYKVSKKITGLFSTNIFHFDKLWDVNSDNFTDVTIQKRIALFNKFAWQHKSGKSTQLALRYYYEDRWGGEKKWNTSYRGSDSIYGESIYTNRFEFIGVTPLTFIKNDFKLQYSFNRHVQNSAYGNTPFKAEQNIGFVQLLKNIELISHDILIGTALRYTYYDDNTVITQTDDTINPINKPINTYLPGIFLQDEWKFNENNSILTGIRYDYNNLHGSILSPRINWKSTLRDKNIFRLGIGNGYRVVNLFSEDHAAFNGARKVVVLDDLKPEQSWNANINYTINKQIKSVNLSLDVNCFYTYFSNKIVADYFTDHTKVIFDNLKGYGINRGTGVNLHWTFKFPLKIATGATFTDVYIMKHDTNNVLVKSRQVHTPKLTSNFVISYTLEKIKTSIDLSGNIYSPMLLPILPNDYRPAYSPWFCIMNLQVSKEMKNWQLYGGCKNLLDFLPKEDPIMRAFDPFDKKINDPINNPNNFTFDPGYNYAPYQRARLFLGVRFKIK